jgi:hypothetical protein
MSWQRAIPRRDLWRMAFTVYEGAAVVHGALVRRARPLAARRARFNNLIKHIGATNKRIAPSLWCGGGGSRCGGEKPILLPSAHLVLKARRQHDDAVSLSVVHEKILVLET